MSNPTRAGYVALIGLPNAGKSSLLNRLLGSKLSIVTPFAQTTRERVVGIDTEGGVQMVFLDTPGIVDPAYLLHHAMTEVVAQALEDADVAILLLDGTRPAPSFAPEVMETLRGFGAQLLVAVNKVDQAPSSMLRELRAWSAAEFGRDPLRISAETGAGVSELRAGVAALLPESPFFFPEDELSTQTLRFFVSELVRETAFEIYKEEVPYSIAVRVEEFREEETPLFIRAVLYVERASQKAIVIGRGGAAIRELGTTARGKIEEFLDTRVYLDLWVKVLPKWRKDPLELRRLGFPVPSDPPNHA
jgi:GTP-binding protein Era